jgi:hypothetical protein
VDGRCCLSKTEGGECRDGEIVVRPGDGGLEGVRRGSSDVSGTYRSS